MVFIGIQGGPSMIESFMNLKRLGFMTTVTRILETQCGNKNKVEKKDDHAVGSSK